MSRLRNNDEAILVNMPLPRQAIKFAKVPITALTDRRLSLRQLKVLCALFSFADNDGVCWPTKQTLSVRSSIHIKHISECTAALAALGWLSKTGQGGFSLPARYVLLDGTTSANSVSGDGKTTRAELATASPGSGLDEGQITSPNLGTSSPDSGLDRKQLPAPIQENYKPQSRKTTSPESGLRKELTKELTIELTNNQDQKIPAEQVSPTNPKPISKRANARLAADGVGEIETELQSACRETWKSYLEAYQQRYGIPPLRNQTVNSQVKQFVQRVGFQDAPLIAGWFTAHNATWYVRQGHTIGSLLRDAEKLRTEWATGRALTETSTRQLDGAQSNFNASTDAKRMLGNRRPHHG